MNKYFKNFILCGEIDYHCLLCKESFADISDLDKHIRWEKHRKNTKEQSYFPKYKKDSIFKIENKFYCEVCNYVVESDEALFKHIKNDKHVGLKKNPAENVNKPTIAKREKYLVFIEDVALNSNQWHGIIDKKCLLCDIGVKDDKHIDSQIHMINLIQADNIYEDGGKVYRKITSNTMYCFICQDLFLLENSSEHWKEKRHIEKKTISSRKAKPEASTSLASEDNVTRKLMESQKEFYNIDMDNKVVTCKRCKKTFSLNFRSLIDHKKRHDKQSSIHELIFDHGKMRAQLKEFGKQHFIKLIRGGSKGYCMMCNVFFSAHIINFKDHIRGTRHVGFLNAKGIVPTSVMYAKPQYKSVPFMLFLTHLYHSGSMKVFWVNKTYCIDTFSFVYVCPIPNKPFYEKSVCFACDVIYPMEKKTEHCKLESHKQKVLCSSFITTLPGEFVRELHPNIYHCGFCNQIFPYWVNLDKHLRSFQHVEIRHSKELMCHLSHRMFKDCTPEELTSMNMLTELKGLGIL